MKINSTIIISSTELQKNHKICETNICHIVLYVKNNRTNLIPNSTSPLRNLSDVLHNLICSLAAGAEQDFYLTLSHTFQK